MSVDRETVERVAELARLNLDSDEKKELARQLARILEFVAQLDEVDISDVPPTKHVIDLINIERADEMRDSLSPEDALAGAPSADAGHFVVPKVLPD